LFSADTFLLFEKTQIYRTEGLGVESLGFGVKPKVRGMSGRYYRLTTLASVEFEGNLTLYLVAP
jgi:hypothetical protein